MKFREAVGEDFVEVESDDADVISHAVKIFHDCRRLLADRQVAQEAEQRKLREFVETRRIERERGDRVRDLCRELRDIAPNLLHRSMR